ncbi:hypothetical protein V5799_027400 [Amblyomma americanum]|uniref:Uncharacterized protein n=1 Tax=Amblyomma americanum TaxID=6943 RepID=A0AAQ4DFU2_AMBAM
MLTKAKRPHFIDSCRPAVFTSNGTEALVCPEVLTSKAPKGNLGEPLNAADMLSPRRFSKGNKRLRSALKTWAHSLSTRRYHGISDVLLQIRDHIADDTRQRYHYGIGDLKDKAQRYCDPQAAEFSTEQPEGEPARKDAVEKSKISAVSRQPEGKEEAGKALKGSSEKRQSVTVDSKPPRAKTSVGRDDWKASTTVAPMPQPFPLVESRRTVTAPQTAHDKPAGAEFSKLSSVPSHQTDSGSSPQDLPPKPQEAAPTKPESAKAVRKSSKSSVGVVSTASGRHQASLLNAARRKSRVSRMSFKTTISGTAEPPQDLPGPAASATPAAFPEVAPVAAQPELTKPSTSDKAPSCGIPGNQSLENPEGEITRKPSTAQLAQPTTSKVDGAEKSEKAFTGAAVEAVPDASQASQTGRASPKRSVSEKVGYLLPNLY